MPADSNPRAASDIDKFIGAQIRVRRAAMRLSQEGLAEAIGVTFQQIQKYEKGVNRVSAAALFRIARALETEASALMPSVFDGGPTRHALADFEDMSILTQPVSRLNSQGRALLVVLAQALATQPALRA
jgi:transcriptional regulator with XRE-family HTH domain